MEDLEKMLCKLIVPAVGDRGMELVELGHSMINDSDDEMDKFGVELIQIGNHIADWTMKVLTVADPKAAEELRPKFDDMQKAWKEGNPDVPFLR